MERLARFLLGATICLAGFLFAAASTCPGSNASKQHSLEEWRSLTSQAAQPPTVWVKGDHIHFYFGEQTNRLGFSATLSLLRVPTDGYKVRTAMLRLDPKLPAEPESKRGWRQAAVIAGAEWQRLSTNLIEELTPLTPGRGVYYQGLLADRLLYRDALGHARSAAISQQLETVIIERTYSMEETLQILARLVEQQLVASRPNDSLFVLMAPSSRRFPQPLLLDRQQRQCVWLAPAALYDNTERGISLAVTAAGLRALFLESHGLELLKNPLSSAARLADLAVQVPLGLLGRLAHRPGKHPAPISQRKGMALPEWEHWLDRYTGTRAEDGNLKLLIDGERFFPRLHQAIAEATNHIHLDVYIFDRDDVAVEVADQLKQRSAEIPVKIILDQMGSLAAGTKLPATPMPEDFVLPFSITSYLRQNSHVQVRRFFNPWFSSDHSKVFLVDGTHAWVGGMNVGREYRYEWHDLMVELAGPVVGSLEEGFRRAWAHESLLGDLAYGAALLTPPKPAVAQRSTEPWMKVRLLPTKTAWKPFNAAVQGAIRRSQDYIYVENPYLFDKRVIRNLVRARNRGVDVRVVLPRLNDFKAASRSNLVLANYLLAHGVRVYFYPGMTHVKALLIDDWACLGSGNLNLFSLRLCQEQNVATSDPQFTADLKRDLFEEDFARSYELKEPISVGWLDFLADTVLEGF